MTMTDQEPRTQHLERPGGRLAYDVSGSGPLVVCVPGMGDLRHSYRFLVPALVEAGYRVATIDLRGHGDSDTGFDAFDDLAGASDVAAFIEHLGGPATIVGNSMGAAIAVIVAADRPELVDQMVLVGPFVRDVPTVPGMTVLLRLALLRPWGPALWRTWHRRLFPSGVPDDYADYQERLDASMRRPGAWRAFQRTARTSHRPAEERLGAVTAPARVLMGTADPDFQDAAAEAQFVSDRLGADIVLLSGLGHYPHAESPESASSAIIEFLGRHA